MKVGDRVRVRGEHYKVPRGYTGTVIGFSVRFPKVGVEFDRFIAGHTCSLGGLRGKKGHCWWMQEYSIEPLNVSDPEYEELLV